MNGLKLLVYTIVVICVIGALLSNGRVQGLFAQMMILLIIFIVVVEFLPQFIVAPESK